MSYSLSTPSIGHGKPAEDLSLQGETTQGCTSPFRIQSTSRYFGRKGVCLFGATCKCQGLSWHFIYFIFASPLIGSDDITHCLSYSWKSLSLHHNTASKWGDLWSTVTTSSKTLSLSTVLHCLAGPELDPGRPWLNTVVHFCLTDMTEE